MRLFQASLFSVAGQNKVKSLVPMSLWGRPVQKLCTYKFSQNTTAGLNLNVNGHRRFGFFL